MKRYHAGIALVVLAALLSTGAVWGWQDSATPPDGYDPEPVEPYFGHSDFLILKDVDPWGNPENAKRLDARGYSYDVTTSTGFSTFDLTARGTRVILVASDQTSGFYSNMASPTNSTKLSNFVTDGGVLIAHMADNQTSMPLWAPGDVTRNRYTSNQASITDPTHPVLSEVTDAGLDWWTYSTHGHLTGLPAGHSVLATNTSNDGPCYAEYGWGNGVVLASTFTFEWTGGSNLATREVMAGNEMDYALSQYSESDADDSPEPATWVLLACTAAFGAWRRRT